MLQIEKTQDGTGMTVSITSNGSTPYRRLILTTRSTRSSTVWQDLTIDVAELEYISSAGLRVLLTAAKGHGCQGRYLHHRQRSAEH